MGAQALDDLREQLLLWRRCTRRQVGQRAEPDPAVETVRRGSIELGALGSKLLGDLAGRPVGDPGANHRDPGRRDVAETVGGRPIREDERECHSLRSAGPVR